jgi:hypothetical protein
MIAEAPARTLTKDGGFQLTNAFTKPSNRFLYSPLHSEPIALWKTIVRTAFKLPRLEVRIELNNLLFANCVILADLPLVFFQPDFLFLALLPALFV